MLIKNSVEKFGILTKFLHWLIALLFFSQFFLIYRREEFPKGSPEKAQYLLLHESFGITIFILGAIMITWRFINVRPIFPMNMSPLEIIAAKVVHTLLYLYMLIMPLSGVLMSLLGGYDVFFFGHQLPNPFMKNEHLSDLFFKFHEASAYIIGTLITIHVLAALYHHFIKKDNVLRRMR